MKKVFGTLLLLGIGSSAEAQQPAATVIAIPPLTSPDSGTKGNEMLAIGWIRKILTFIPGFGKHIWR